MRALVTGSAGFIGSHLSESLLQDGHAVIGVDCFNENYGRAQKLRNLERARQWDSYEFVPIDLSRGDLADLVHDCDVVFHLAAEPGVRASWGQRFESYVRNNVSGTQHLLEASALAPEKRFVFASSSSVYGQAEALPTSEDALPQPLSPYGVTKLAAEKLCLLYHANHGVNAVALRYFSVYGPRQRPDMAFHIFCRAALAGEPIPLFGGDQTRDFTFVADIVAATRAAGEMEGIDGQVFNVGGGSRTSMSRVLDVLSEISGRQLQVVRQEAQHGDPRDTAADISAARQALGYAPSVDLEKGLAEEWEWVLSTQSSLTVG